LAEVIQYPRYGGDSDDVDAEVAPQQAAVLEMREIAPGIRPISDVEIASDKSVAVPWNELMRKHGRRVIVSLVGRGIAMERAQELAQEAWMRIIAQQRAGRLERLEMPGIVVAQANFLARDEHRRRGRRARMGLSTLREPGAEVAELAEAVTGPDLERRVGARQSLRRVLEVVDRAYPNAQRVFHLLYGDDPKTPVEVAATTGLSVQRVRQILCELRKAIRNEFEPNAGGTTA